MAANEREFTRIVLCFALAVLVGCNKAPADHPRITSNVVLRDETFRSAALGREMRYRVLLPTFINLERKRGVLYLLHGNGSNFRDWSNFSDVARFAESNLILVMPQGDNSYYINAVERPRDRYEDYIIRDLIPDVEAKFHIAPDRQNRAIAGVSMGGYGAIKLALSHPDLFAFAGSLSGPLDVPRRAFSIKRIQQSMAFRSIFGPPGSEARRLDDPFTLARPADAANAPYLFLSCGDQESLLPVNREFAALLERQHLQYEFHVAQGGHNWNHWNKELPILFKRLRSSAFISGQ